MYPIKWPVSVSASCAYSKLYEIYHAYQRQMDIDAILVIINCGGANIANIPDGLVLYKYVFSSDS